MEKSPKLEIIQITVVLNLSQREEKLILITTGPSVSSSPLYACLSFFLDCSHIPARTADPTPSVVFQHAAGVTDD